MKNNYILTAVIGGGLAGAAWAVGHFGVSIAVDQVIGYGAVVTLLALGAMDYGFRLFR